MHRRTLAVAVPAAVLAACASKVEAPADNSPANTTAVFETLVVNGGIMGMFPFEVNEKHYVRGDMRRDEHATKGTGTFSGWLVSAVSGDGDTTVVRLDDDKRWLINNGKKEYTECPAHGCPVAPREQKQQKQKPEAQQQEPKQQAEKGCTARIASNTFDVKETGATRTINGFSTGNYAVSWVVRMQDPQKRVTTSTVSADVWTTPVSAEMRQAFGTESAFSRAYGASRPMKSSADAKAIPPEVTGMMSAYLSSLSPADRAHLANIGHQLARIKGYPIQSRIEWRLAGNACGSDSQSARQTSPTTASGVASSLGGLFGKKEAQSGDTPILSFTIETKAVKVEPVRDSVFGVPAGYKRIN